MFFTNVRFNYASFAAKYHLITEIESSILKKSTRCLSIEYIKIDIFSTCIASPIPTKQY